ncbi:MAG: NUDIX hydrolase [Rubricella sp.]
MTDDNQPIRDAATVIVLRDGADGPRVLMGQRGAKAAFMPSKYVFPGGAVDDTDAAITPARALGPHVAARLQADAPPGFGPALASAAVRELWEETGLALARPGSQPEPVPSGWEGFVERAGLPDHAPLDFIFRAVTPPGRPRRFDARFFLVDAGALECDPDDFSGACDELSHLHWIGLRQARDLNLPFITEVVLAEVEDILREGTGPDRPVPFFRHEDGRSHFRMLTGA